MKRTPDMNWPPPPPPPPPPPMRANRLHQFIPNAAFRTVACAVCGREKSDKDYHVQESEHSFPDCDCVAPADCPSPKPVKVECAHCRQAIRPNGQRLGICESASQAEPWTAAEMLEQIVASLEMRADGIDGGGDIRVMAAVDRILQREREAHAETRSRLYTLMVTKERDSR